MDPYLSILYGAIYDKYHRGYPFDWHEQVLAKSTRILPCGCMLSSIRSNLYVALIVAQNKRLGEAKAIAIAQLEN